MTSMYNLLVGFPDGAAFASRLFEYTDVGVKSVVAPGGGIDVARLMSLPTLLMPEIDSDAPQVARVGRIEGLVRSGATTDRALRELLDHEQVAGSSGGVLNDVDVPEDLTLLAGWEVKCRAQWSLA